MEPGNDNDLKSLPTTIVDKSDISKSGKKLEYSSSSSFDFSGAAHGDYHGISAADDGGVLNPKLIEQSMVQQTEIEPNNFNDMIRLDSSSSSETEKHATESRNSATFQELDGPKMKPDDSNQTGLAIEHDDDIEITSSDEDDNPLNYFEVKSALSASQSELSYLNKVQVDVIDQPLQAKDDQNASLSMATVEEKPDAEFLPRKTPIYLFSASSSSNSESSNEETFQMDSKETRKSLDPLSDEDIPISSMPREGQSPTQSPQLQAMERNEDPSSSPYRIPSHIFARNKSNTPAEWSTASNESLFSIHMGNSSFSRDQLCWLGKSGELCKPKEAIAPPYAESSSSQLPSFKSTEIGQKNNNLAEEAVVTEAKAAETMREVIRESAENENQQKTVLGQTVSRSTNLSQRSDGSTKSFAFPILTGEGEKSVSLKGGAEKQKQHFQSPPQSQPPSQPTTPKNSNAVQSSKSIKAGFNMRCFSCLSCCPFSFRK